MAGKLSKKMFKDLKKWKTVFPSSARIEVFKEALFQEFLDRCLEELKETRENPNSIDVCVQVREVRPAPKAQPKDLVTPFGTLPCN